ncbi:MAG: aminoglycoside phosphotransferase family protein [Gammaproteobacteria bacterium]
MTASDTGQSVDERLSLLTNWAKQHILSPIVTIEPASADASFRRYFRIVHKRGSVIAMDSPPEQEPLNGFIAIARQLRAGGLRAPRVLASDLGSGFALLSDLGPSTYLNVLTEDAELADELYGDAIHRLVGLQQRLDSSALPPYDEALLRTELGIFTEWLLGKHLNIQLSDEDRAQWATLCDGLVVSALDQPRVFVHRDFHSRNLMRGPPGDPGILDFQDAVCGPITYDLVSLLRDCYVTWPAQSVSRWQAGYYDLATQTPLADVLPARDVFHTQFDLMGVQRHIKAAGIFARLWHRDGKAGYLPDVPRTLAHILSVEHPSLNWLHGLLREKVIPALKLK